jgi:hypothetical protein
MGHVDRWFLWLVKYLALYTLFLMVGADFLLMALGAPPGLGLLAPIVAWPAYYGALVYAAILVVLRNLPGTRPLAALASPAAVFPALAFPLEGNRWTAIVLGFAFVFGLLVPLPPRLRRESARAQLAEPS